MTGAQSAPAAAPATAPSPGALMLRQFVPKLPIQAETPTPHRRVLGAAAAVLGLIIAWAGWRCLTRGGDGVLWLGFGRLARLAHQTSPKLAAFIGGAEHAQFAAMLLWFGASLALGGTRRPAPGRAEVLVYHRVQYPHLHAPWIVLALAALVLAHGLVAAGHPILASLIEIPALSLGLAALWRCALPEARISITVIADANQGFGNRVVVSGGRFNNTGRLIIRHDELESATVVDTPWSRLMQFRSLDLLHRDPELGLQRVRIPAAGDDESLGILSGYLRGGFKRALTRHVIDYPAALQRGLDQLN